MRLRVVSLPATDEQQEEEVDLEAGELLAVDLGVGEHRDEVVLRVGALLLGELRAYAYSSIDACWAISSVMPYSGSSAPIMRLLQSKSLCRSSWGTPMRSAITWSGSSDGDVDDEVALAAVGDLVDDLAGALAHRRLELATPSAA